MLAAYVLLMAASVSSTLLAGGMYLAQVTALVMVPSFVAV